MKVVNWTGAAGTNRTEQLPTTAVSTQSPATPPAGGGILLNIINKHKYLKTNFILQVKKYIKIKDKKIHKYLYSQNVDYNQTWIQLDILIKEDEDDDQTWTGQQDIDNKTVRQSMDILVAVALTIFHIINQT